MGFGSKLRKRLKHAAKAALNPVKGGVDLSRHVTKALHPVTTAIGKLDASIYTGTMGGIAGVAYIAKRAKSKSGSKVFGKSAAPVASKVLPLEKAGLGVAGGLIAGGIGSAIAGDIGDAIAPTGGGTSGVDSLVQPGATSQDAIAPGGGGNGLVVVVLVGGGLLLVLLLTKKRRKR